MASDLAPAVFHRILIDGALLSISASAIILLSIRTNPRLWLQDFPKDIQNAVAAKTAAERRLSLIWGVPFLALLVVAPLVSDVLLKRDIGAPPGFLPLWLNGFGVLLFFNLVDLVVIDWVIVCVLTPSFVVVPGTEGHPGYRNYGHHARGFLVGTAGSAAIAVILAALASMG